MISNGGRGYSNSLVSPPSGLNLNNSAISRPTEAVAKNQQALDDVSTHFDLQSNAGLSMISRGTMKGRREVQIRKLELELQRLTKRYDQVTDPIYISDLRHKLKQMEKDYEQIQKNKNKLEIEQTLLDKQLQQAEKQRNQEYLNVDGQIVDKKSAQMVEAQMGIEYAEKKLEQQELEMARV